jgi:hypothetical protein
MIRSFCEISATAAVSPSAPAATEDIDTNAKFANNKLTKIFFILTPRLKLIKLNR